MAFNFTPAGIRTIPLDFSGIANLPDAFWQGQKQARQNAINNAIKSIPVGPNGSIDLGAAAKSLMAAGDYPDAIAASQAATGATQITNVKDMMGNETPYAVNLKTLKAQPITGFGPIQPGAPTQQANGLNNSALANPDLHGDDFLNASGLPENIKASIRAIARGDQLPPSTNRPQGNAIMGFVNQYDPTYSQAIAPTSPEARQTLEDVIQPRFSEQGDRLRAFLTDVVNGKGAQDARETLQCQAEAANKPAYASAYADPKAQAL
jgi:hypothetical protein